MNYCGSGGDYGTFANEDVKPGVSGGYRLKESCEIGKIYVLEEGVWDWTGSAEDLAVEYWIVFRRWLVALQDNQGAVVEQNATFGCFDCA